MMTENQAPRCPQHPEEPQVQAQGKKRAGQYLGRCTICLAAGARAAAAKRKANNAARRQTAAEIPPSPPLPKGGAGAPAPALAALEPEPAEVEARLVSAGLLLDFSEWPELLRQLQDRAREEIRTPAQQVLFFIKLGLKNAGGGALDQPLESRTGETPVPPEKAEVGEIEPNPPRSGAQELSPEASARGESGPAVRKKPKKRRWDRSGMTKVVARSLNLV